jgi:hypothetical protein
VLTAVVVSERALPEETLGPVAIETLDRGAHVARAPTLDDIDVDLEAEGRESGRRR